MNAARKSAGTSLLALSWTLAPLCVAGAGLSVAAPAQAQSVCLPDVLGNIACTGAGVPPVTPPGTPPGTTVPPVLAPPPIAGPVTATLADGFQSPDTVNITTIGSGSDVTLNALGTAAINTVNEPGLVIDSGGNITGRITNITTTGTGADGALLRAADNIIFTSDGTIATTGDNAPAIDAQGRSVAVDANVLRTVGDNSNAAQLNSLNGPTSLNAGLIETNGNLSNGAVLSGTGTTTLSGRTIRTAGTDAAAFSISNDAASCVVLGNGGCDKTANVDNVTTNGFGSVGGLVTGAGRTNVTIGALQTGGDQAAGLDLSTDPAACVALGAGACGTAFTVNDLTTQGARSPGAIVRGGGPISANVGALRTNGNQAAGLDLASDPTTCAVLGAGQCDTSFSAGQLTTNGDGATGALIRSSGATTGNVGVLRTNGNSLSTRSTTHSMTCMLVTASDVWSIWVLQNDYARANRNCKEHIERPRS